MLRRLGEKYRISATDLMFDQHRLYTADLMKGTPPRTLAIGRNAIHKDLKKIFIEMDKQVVLDWYADNFGKRSKGVGKNARSAIRGKLEGAGVIFNWNGDKTRMKSFHESTRRGPNKTVKFKSETIPVGFGMQLGTGMYANKNKIKAYEREKQKSVGKLKAGWARAAQHYGVRLPAFVSKQAVRMGGYHDKIDKKEVDISLTSINSIPWAQRKLRDLMVFATNKREKDLTTNLENAIKRVANKWSQSKNG
jgi:hypothetical protein